MPMGKPNMTMMMRNTSLSMMQRVNSPKQPRAEAVRRLRGPKRATNVSQVQANMKEITMLTYLKILNLDSHSHSYPLKGNWRRGLRLRKKMNHLDKLNQ